MGRAFKARELAVTRRLGGSTPLTCRHSQLTSVKFHDGKEVPVMLLFAYCLVYPDDLTQQSWFEVAADHVRPEKYRAEEGASSVSLDFDWDGGRARGMS